MDDAQVQSWRDGDAMAAAAVRNALRAIADAVLAAPVGNVGGGRRGSLVRSADTRREVAGTVAREVMQRGGATAADLRALAVMVGARHVVSDERELRPEGGEGHLPPQLVVSLALAPDSLTGHAKTIADRHVGECGQCQADVDLVRTVVKRVTLPRPVAPAARAEAAVAPEDAPTRTDDPSAQQAAAQAPAAPARAPTPPRRRGKPKPRPRPRAGRLDQPDTVPVWKAAWPLVAIVVVLFTLYMVRSGSEASEDQGAALSALASRDPGELPYPEDLPEDVDSAAYDLEQGDCRAAADRLTLGRQRHPDDSVVAWWAGVSQVCAGDGVQAIDAFDHYLAAGGHSSGDLLWFQAQAMLLQGDARAARERLISARPLVESDRGLVIDSQLEQLRSLNR